jgi:hypothetical protein
LTEFDPRDRALLRKEGEERRLRQFAGNREEKSWLQKPVYMATSLHVRPVEDLGQGCGNEEEPEEAEKSPVDTILEEFEDAKHASTLPAHPGGLQVKRVFSFVPSRNLRQLNLYMVRFDPQEQLSGNLGDPEEDDVWRGAHGILVKRRRTEPLRTRPGPNEAFDPLTLLLPGRAKVAGERDAGHEEELKLDGGDQDLFGAEEDEDDSALQRQAKPDLTKANVVRDYKVAITTDVNEHRRYAVVLSETQARFVELERQSLKLSRSKTNAADMETGIAILASDEGIQERRRQRLDELERRGE